LCPFLLEVPADLPDQHDGFCLRVVFKPLQHINKRLPDHRVTTDPDNCALPDAGPGELVHHLVRERAGSRDHADIAAGKELGWHDPHLDFTGRKQPGAVRPNHETPLHLCVRDRLHRVMDRDMLGDADNRADTGVCLLHDRIGCRTCRDKDHGCSDVVVAHRLFHRVVDRDTVHLLPALSRGHTGNHAPTTGLL
jgi:hypothetical protein